MKIIEETTIIQKQMRLISLTPTTTLMLSLLLCLTLTTKTAHSAYTSISTAAQLKSFANEVNAGTSYSGSTVTLTNDIDMSSITDFPCIGVFTSGGSTDFRGTFDGYGYSIKNFKITTSSIRYAGLFGYSNGGTIKNVVIDSSSTVTNRESTCGYAAGIVGYVNAGASQAIILNCVNMGTITGSGPYSKVAGIAGYLCGCTYTAIVMNCVNVGAIKYTGTATRSYVGGIVGWMSTTKLAPSVLNCVNLGTVTATHTIVGAIVGNSTFSSGAIKNCYWLSGTASQCYKGTATASGNYAFDASYTLTTGSALVTTLNNYVTSQSTYTLQKWSTATFSVNGGSTVNPKLIMWVMLGTPDTPTKSEGTFKGWYTNSGLTTAWSSSTRYGSGEGVTLYAKWEMNQYTVTFNSDGGSTVSSVTQDYGTSIGLSTPTKEGHKFNGWKDGSGTVHVNSYTIKGHVTLTAQWTVNQYTVTFNSNGGSSVSSVTKDYGTTITLGKSTKEGHTFDGWKDTSGTVYKDTYTIKGHVTLTAQWTVNQYTVTFNSDGGSAVSSVTKDYGTTITLGKSTKEGHTFDGWKDASGTVYKDTYAIKASVTLTAQWTANSYTVTFNSDGGSEVQSVTKDYGTTITLSKPTKEGHKFDGWKDINGQVYTGTYTIKASVTLTAQWTVNQYTVTFDSNGGPTVQSVTKDYGTTITLSTPTKEGHTFNYWYDSDGNTYTGTYTIMKHVTLTAQWKVNQYTVTFNSDGGSAVQSVTKDYGTTITLSTPTKEGHTFDGWKDAGGSVYTNSYTIKANTILTAQWKVNQYTVTFNSDGGSAVPSVTKDYGTTITLGKSTKEGHTFNYWYDSDGNTYTDTYTIKKHVTLTAQWKVNQYTVTFNSDGGSAVQSVTKDYGTIITLGKSTKEGHTFDGWKDASGSVYKDTYTIKGHVTLTAQWTVNQYTVTFNSDGGSAVSSVTKDYGTTITLGKSTKEGHTFNYWYDSDGNTYTGTYTIKKHVTLTAQWKVNQYTVTFDSNGGSAVPSVTKDYGTSITLSTPTKEGHTFNGWKDTSGSVYTNSYTIKANTILTAQWTVIQYTVTFNSNGGSAVQSVTKDYGTTITLGKSTKEGHAFDGWKDAGGSVYTNSYTIKANTILTAQWTVNQYTVTFDSNGGPTVPSVTKDYGTTVTLATPTKKGYTFNGWKDTSEAIYIITYTIKGHVTLTAQWSINIYTVAFDVNGGEDLDEPSKTVTYGELYGELPEPINLGHNFLGWFTSNVSGEGELITNETTVNIDDNHTLYALWDVNNYTVTFDFGNGTEIDAFFVFDDEIIYPDDLTKDGHTFLGWNNTYDRMPAEDIIIYAQWDLNNYTVTFDFGNGTVVEELFYYGEVITYPKITEREGHTFVKWNNTYDRMPAEDITIKAIWKVTPTEYVKIEFNKKDMSESEVKDIISKYIDSTDYEIRIVGSENGGTTVIIKFNDVNEAESFVETIKESDDVKDLSYIDDVPLSFSKSVLVPLRMSLSLSIFFLLYLK